MRAGRRTSWRRAWGWTARRCASTPPRPGGGDRAGRAADGRGGLAHAGDRVVPGVGRHPAAAGVLAGHRVAPRLHRRPAQGGGDGRDDPPAAARRARLDGDVASVRRWVRANLPEEARRAQVTVLGDVPPPGEQAQIDYGRLGMWLDPAGGRRRTVWAFVMVLPCSRHCSCARRWRWTRPSGPRRMWRRSRSSAACPPGSCRKMFRGTFSGFCARPGYVAAAPARRRDRWLNRLGRCWPRAT